MPKERGTPENPEIISDEEWSEQPTTAGPDDDDPQGMRGQLDDSMNGLEGDDDIDEAARGIPQNAETADNDHSA